MLFCNNMLFFVLLLLFSVASALPVNANQALTKEPQLIRVSGYQQIEDNFLDIVTNDKADVLFYLEDLKSYLAPYNKSSDGLGSNPENIDKVGTARWPFFKEKPKKKPAISDWVEFQHFDYTSALSRHLVPVSACQSQEYGGSGGITMTWTITQQVLSSISVDFGVDVGVISLALSVGTGVRSAFKVLGSVSCDIKPGSTGQVLVRPNYVTASQRSRRMKFDANKKKFEQNKNIESIVSTVGMTHLRGIVAMCATNDLVPLNCKGKIGEVDWQEIFGAK